MLMRKGKIIFSFFLLFVLLVTGAGYLNNVWAWKSETVLLSGTGNPELSQAVSKILGVSITDAGIERFKNGEVFSKIQGTVRGKDVFVVASFAEINGRSVNDFILEFQVICDAAMRSGAKSIVAVIPSFPYARQDRKTEGRAPITASMIAKVLERVCGVTRVITVDLHSEQIQGFFQNTGVDNLTASKIFAEYIHKLNLQDVVIVSPDAGGAKRAEVFKGYLEAMGVTADFAMMIKKRVKAGEVDKITLVGDVKGKTAIIVDDMCDTGGTLVAAAAELKKFGAIGVYACITHPIFSADAVKKISGSQFEKVLVTNSLPERDSSSDKVVRLSLAPLLAEVIGRIQRGESISKVF